MQQVGLQTGLLDSTGPKPDLLDSTGPKPDLFVYALSCGLGLGEERLGIL